MGSEVPRDRSALAAPETFPTTTQPVIIGRLKLRVNLK